VTSIIFLVYLVSPTGNKSRTELVIISTSL